MKKNSPAYVILFMAAVSCFFGIGIAVIHYATLGTLESNERLYRNRTIAQAFNLRVEAPSAAAYEQALENDLVKDEFTDGARLWQIYTRKSEPGDIGFIFVGMGFWDIIRGIVVLSPDLEKIVSIRFLEEKETPGLGARIEEEWFTGQFEEYRINWDKPADQRVVMGEVSSSEAKRIDAITGATQTSMALERMLNLELAAFRDIYEKRIAVSR